MVSRLNKLVINYFISEREHDGIFEVVDKKKYFIRFYINFFYTFTDD